jgi:hypothetical protein
VIAERMYGLSDEHNDKQLPLCPALQIKCLLRRSRWVTEAAGSCATSVWVQKAIGASSRGLTHSKDSVELINHRIS